ncbi:hypothetical protein LO763_22535 [Glycomyces sp. A-F 0318]|uniref:hypothetical protein n=1 Tax=Glycomyces amatae TaxID=2881355 RepID=UPI001E3D477B|nr:hypothetical protein [Glycomyces amatae]MCD0446397.1 hypothetical protein [Glycomyces amatae]
MQHQPRTDERALKNAKTIPMTLQARIVPPQPDLVALAAAIGPAGEALALWGPASLNPRLHARTGGEHQPSFPATATDAPWTASLVVTHPDGRTHVLYIGGLTITFPMIQPLPDGAFLMVGPRCEYTAAGPQHNAVVIGPDGSTLRTGVLGDGIEDVRTTTSGRVIVGYFDEGVFGNLGWGGPNGPDPIGAPGLVEFDADLQQVWTYPVGEESPPPTIDCYTLNIVGETVWACPYTDFPVLRIEDDEIAVWRNELAAGAHHLLVHHATVAFVGGYGFGGDVLTVAALEDGRTTTLDTRRIEVAWASPVHDLLHTCAQGAQLHRITTDGHWYTLDLADDEGRHASLPLSPHQVRSCRP